MMIRIPMKVSRIIIMHQSPLFNKFMLIKLDCFVQVLNIQQLLIPVIAKTKNQLIEEAQLQAASNFIASRGMTEGKHCVISL